MNDELAMVFFYLILAVLFIAIPACGSYERASNNSYCLSKGYREGNVTYGGFGTAYCIQRKDQTDVVVPVSEMR